VVAARGCKHDVTPDSFHATGKRRWCFCTFTSTLEDQHFGWLDNFAGMVGDKLPYDV
jgi:hypothetical protein